MTVEELIKELRIKAIGGEVLRPKELFDIYKIANDANNHRAAREFRVGNRVKFRGKKMGPNAGTLEGKIERISGKTISVVADTKNGRELSFSQRWTVSAGALTLIGNGLQELVRINNDKPSNSVDNAAPKGLSCPYCNRVCSSSSGLTLHKKCCKGRDR